MDNSTTDEAQPFAISETEWTNLKEQLDKRYAEIATLLRYNKTKDESVRRLGDEIQKYRDGFAFSALKPFVNALIALREDCRKSIKDTKQFPDKFTDENVKKYAGYLVSDFEEMLSNVGLERKDGSISIHGKPISELTPPPPPSLQAEPSSEETPEPVKAQTEPIKNFAELVSYLKESENAIELAIKDRAIVDKTIQEYVKFAARTDAVHYFALAAPVAKQIYKLFDYVSQEAAKAENSSGEELMKLYAKTLETIMEKIYGVLTVTAGMEIDSPDGAFDTKKHKILKTVPTDDEKLDRTVANVYTDCYVFDEKVIYQSKVDVYKLNLVSTQGG